MTESQRDEQRITRLCRSNPAPCARETRTPTEVSTPMPKTKATLIRLFAKAAAARALVPTRPTISVSTKPINICPTCPAIIGPASAKVLAISVRNCRRFDIDRSPNQDFTLWQLWGTCWRIGVSACRRSQSVNFVEKIVMRSYPLKRRHADSPIRRTISPDRRHASAAPSFAFRRRRFHIRG
jgi:hypothetical protein